MLKSLFSFITLTFAFVAIAAPSTEYDSWTFEDYVQYVDIVMFEGAENPAHLQTLLEATVAFTEADPSNEQYFPLLQVADMFPEKLEAAIVAFPVDEEVRAEIRETLVLAKEAWTSEEEEN